MRLQPAISWLTSVGPSPMGTAELLDGLWTRVEAAGVPVARALVAVRTIHPQLVGLGYMWRRGQGVTCDEHPHGELETQRYRESPLRVIFDEGSPPIRYRLDGRVPLPYPVLMELRGQGLTDYMAFPLPCCDGRRHALTITTDVAGGLDNDTWAELVELAAILAMAIEVRETRRVAATLLDTYVGPRAGAKILDGWIRRGDLAVIDAVVLCGDLRGFTPLTVELAPAEVVAVLNDYFEAVCTPVRDSGGEILKFIGDGVLATYAVDGPDGVRGACAAALAGADGALAALDALGPRPTGAGGRAREVRLRMGLALHVGQVAFGNVGSTSRLDFTVIGRTVNVASRLADLCARLNHPLLVSSAFVRHLPEGALPLGPQVVRGLPEPEELFTYALPRAGRRPA